MSSSVVVPTVEIVFIDAGVPDLEQLLGGLRDGVEAFVLDGDADPVLQMRDALAGRTEIDAIHVVAHGEDGAVDFVGGRLSAAEIEAHAEALREIGGALSEDGDILLWSCDTGRGELGQSFVEALARATGADVAASNDLTGAAFLGGDWDLETTAGTIEADSPMTADGAAGYDQVLAPETRVINPIKLVGDDASELVFVAGSHVDTDGNTYISGRMHGSIDFDTGPGSYVLTTSNPNDAAFVAKYAADGSLAWARMWDSDTAADSYHHQANAVISDADGNVYVTGQFFGEIDADPGAGTHTLTGSTTNTDAFVIKLDADGNFGSAVSFGGGVSDSGVALELAANGNIIAAGHFYGVVDFDPGAGTNNLGTASAKHIYVAELSTADLSVTWVSAAVNNGGDPTLYDINVGPDGAVYAAGSFYSFSDVDPGAATVSASASSVNDGFVWKLNADGSYAAFNGQDGNSNNFIRAMTTDASGNIYVGGSFADTVDVDFGVGTSTLTTAGAADFYIAKYNSSLELTWVKQIGGTGNDQAIGLELDANGDLLLSAFFSNTVDFDPGAGTVELTSGGLTDIAHAKFDTDGNLIWAKQIASAGADIYGEIHDDGAGAYRVVGRAMQTADIDPGEGTDYVVPSATNKAATFVASWSSDGTFAEPAAGPATPSTPDLSAASDSGASSTDNMTAATSLTFDGSGAEVGATITVWNDADNDGIVDAGEAFGTTVAAGDAWSVAVDASGLSDGAHGFKAMQTSGGVDSAASGALSVTIDRTGPVFDAAASSPADDAGTVSAGSDIVLAFDEPVLAGASGTIRLHDASTGELIESFATDSARITGWGTDRLTIDPTEDMPKGSHVSVRWDAASIQDAAGNGIAANGGDTLYDFTVPKTTLLFRSGHGHLESNQLYVTDAVVGGYNPDTGKAGAVVDHAPNMTDGLTGELFMFNGQLYGGFTSGENGIYEGLGRFDGTDVEFLGELGTTSGDGETGLGNFVVFQDDLYFTAKDQSGHVQLGRFDPDSGTVDLVTDLASGIFGHIQPVVYDGNLYFVAMNSASVGGYAVSETMRWTGSEVEAVPGYNLYNASSLFAANGLLYVGAGTGSSSTDRELWSYDGNSTALVAEIADGTHSSHPTNFTEFDGKVFFTAYVGATNSDQRLFSLDGGVVTEEYNPGGYFGELAVLDGKLYFTAGVDGNDDFDILRYDATGVTTQITDLNLSASGVQRPAGLTYSDGAIYFAAGPGDDREIYRVDPTTGDTTKVTDIHTDASSVAGWDPSIVVWHGNLAPLVDEARGPFAITADGGPAAIAAGLEVTDLDDTSMTGATVKIVSGFVAGDTLAAVEQHGITADYDGDTGTLTLSGTATSAQYQDVMRSVTLDPAGSSGERQIQFQVADGDGVSSADALSGRAIVTVTGGSIVEVDFATAPDGLAEESQTNAFTVSDADLGGIRFVATNSGLDVANADIVPIADAAAYGMSYDATAQALAVTPDWTDGPRFLVISSGNGGEFDLQGFAWADESGNSSGIVVTGYRDGVQLESYRYEDAWDSSLSSIVLPSGFDAVDEVRISSNWLDNWDYALGGTFDDFLILPAEPPEAAPSLTATGVDPTFTEDGSAVGLFSGAAASANDDGQSLTALVLTVAGVADGEAEILGLDGTDVTLTDGTSLTTALNGLSVSVTVAGDTATVTLSSGAGLSGAALAAVVDGMTYRNTSEAPTGSDRTVTLTSLSDDGATNTTAALSIDSTVALIAVNDAPVLADVAVSLAEVKQDAGPPADAVGTLISDLVSFESNVVDPDAGGLSGIAVTAFDTSLGNWKMSLDGGTIWTAVPTLEAGEAVLLRGGDRLYFEPTGDRAGTLGSAITFRAWDQSTGTAGQVADVTINGGTTAFSADTDVAELKIVDNVAPAAPSTPDMVAASDSGVSNTDNVTNDTTPTFTGTAEANATVRLYANGAEVDVVIADGEGNWSATSAELADGTYTFTARAEDAAGNLGTASSGIEVTLDTAAPAAAGTPDLAAAGDSGISSTDNITNAQSLTFTGTATANATVTLLIDGAPTAASTTADGSGNYSIAYDASGLSDGEYVFSTRTSDAAGNVGPDSGGLTVTLDRTAAASTPALDAGSDSGAPGDGITTDTTPTFVGSGAEVGATVYVYANGDEIAQAIVAGDGTWSATGATPLVAGPYDITTRLADGAGNLSDVSAVFAMKIATHAPMVFAQTVGVTENSPLGSFVTQVGVIDLDPDDQHSFKLIDKIGTPEDESQVPFAIDANGEITVSGRIDYETRQTYTLRVQVTDVAGLSTEQDLTVRVNDVAVNDTYFGTDGDDRIAFPGTSGFDSVDGGAGTDELAVTADRMLVVGSAYLGDYLAFSLDVDGIDGYEQFLFSRDVEILDLAAREIRLYGDLSHAGVGANAVTLNGSAVDNYFEAYAITSDHAIIGHGGDGNDVMIGSTNGDTLFGDAGKDVLRGFDGADLLRGGAGADVLDGGSGVDTADYGTSAVGVAISLNSGRGHYGDADGDTLSSVENLEGSAFADHLKGNARTNLLSGGAGADRLEGLEGADSLIGGDGEDVADYSGAKAGVAVSLMSGNGHYSDADGDKLSGIENLIGTAFDDYLKGDNGANKLLGGVGADRLEGLDGDDSLRGGAGADVLQGGVGNDSADYVESVSRVAVSLDTGRGYFGDAEGDTLASIENVTGSSFDDHLKGNAGVNVLHGGAGNDLLEGRVGADTLEGGDGIDTADYHASSVGVAVSLVEGKGSKGDANGDTLVGIENLLGSKQADYLTGDGGSNRLDGGAGADRLEGLGGDDILIGGTGADRFVFADDTGKDTILDFAGGAGVGDVLDFAGNSLLNGFSEVLAHAGQVGADTIIDLGGGDAITLVGVDRLSLHADDFAF